MAFSLNSFIADHDYSMTRLDELETCFEGLELEENFDEKKEKQHSEERNNFGHCPDNV